MKTKLEFSIFHMKIYVHAFTIEIRNLYFTNVQNYMLSFLHVLWNFACIPYEHLAIDFSTQKMEILFFHICKLGHWFSSIKYGILYISHMKISIEILPIKYQIFYVSFRKMWVLIFLHEIFTSLYFKSENLSIDFATRNEFLYLWPFKL